VPSSAPNLEAVDEAIRTGLHSIVPLVGQVASTSSSAAGNACARCSWCSPAVPAGSGTPPAPRHARTSRRSFIEFIHTATLLHDDVVDMSRSARGRDTANEVFGNQATVLVGDFVYSRAFQMMAAVRSQRVIEIMAEATNVIAEVRCCNSMNARDPDTSEQRYLEVIHRKTAQLVPGRR